MDTAAGRATARRKIARRLEKSPSLKRELPNMAVEAYGDAILSAARETDLDEREFPEVMPWPVFLCARFVKSDTQRLTEFSRIRS
ncbi:DUF29 family protein [Salmonella enterica subsp. enterica serovar Kinondoni]|nr:DUF29 family protein [Salmonella enterica subsp. enterica serovar Kinondoni]EJB9810967.1 DUF29 family protein [Salmonella enterica]